MNLIDYKNIDIYQDDTLILKDVNFHVEEGEFLYIIGKVGSGKTSLLRTFYCELDIYNKEESGEKKAEILGRDIMVLKRRDIPALRREIGVIFQDFKLLHEKTIWENLAFVLKSTGWKDSKEIEERIESVLTDVGMIDKINKIPYELSGGEQQRIAIARAILNKPKLIVADEPTGNLDSETADNIISLLRAIATTGTAVIITTHNISLLDKYKGIVYRCKDGVINDVTTEYNKMDLTEDAEYKIP